MADGILNWWYAHNLFGLWLTPMLLAGLYYLVPRVTKTPLYSHTLSLISFWGMAFFYTGVGHHHLLQTPSPGWLKTIAILSSMSLLIPVFAFGPGAELFKGIYENTEIYHKMATLAGVK